VAGEVFGEAWDLYKRFWQHFLPIALVIYLVIAAATLLLDLVLGNFGLLVALVLSFVGIFWLEGAIVLAVQDVRDGRVDLSTQETLSKVRPFLGALIGAGLLAGLGILVGFILLIVPGLILLTWWSLIAPVIVLESSAVIASFGRSRELVRGHGWQVFGVIVVSFLINVVASIILSLALSWLSSGPRSFVQSLVSNTVITPFIAAAWTLMYFKLRGEPEPVAEPAPAV
jgi:hypothetical protein